MGRETTVWIFQAANWQDCIQEDLLKANLKRETESLLIATQNNVIRTNYIKVKIDNTQQNSKCRLYSDRDETINHIISECSKLVQKECKTRYNWMGRVIYRELYKKIQI